MGFVKILQKLESNIETDMLIIYDLMKIAQKLLIGLNKMRLIFLGIISNMGQNGFKLV